jgi:hypothetical protein
MYFPRNWEFGSALSKLRNFAGGGRGGLNPSNPPLGRPLPCSLHGRHAPRLTLRPRQCISTRSVPRNAAYISRLVSAILWTASTLIHGQNRETYHFQFCVLQAPKSLYIYTCSNILSRVAPKHVWIVVQYNIPSGSPVSFFSVKLRIVLRLNDWIMNK